MMESAESIRRYLPQDVWVTSINLEDACFHIPIHRGYRKCLRFQTWDRIYQFRALPFGLSPGPWVFLFSGIPVRPSFLPNHSNFGSISQNQSTDSLITAKPRRVCSYVADPTQSLHPQKNWFVWDGDTPAKPNIASLNIGISMF